MERRDFLRVARVGVGAGHLAHAQHRTEDLGGHHIGVKVRINQHRGCDVSVRRVAGATECDGSAAFAPDQCRNPLEMVVADDATVVGTGMRVGAIERRHRLLDSFDETVAQGSGDEDIVGSDTCLAGVHELAPGDASSGDFDIGISSNDRRTLAP